jgi:uncharacterized protein (DUF2235 family)
MPLTNNAPETRKSKNIVIICDGTGNKFIDVPRPDGSNSNVVKLCTALKIDHEQVAYYHPGVGSAGDPTAKGWIARKWSVLRGLAFGQGFAGNVQDAYRYLMEMYEDGDRVYMFGFSRGSYTVRALAGLLDGYGLLYKGNEGNLLYAWNEYVKQHDDRKRHRVEPNQRFKATFSRPNFQIHFMGIWDTVSSVGWINTPLRLFSVAQNPIIQTGRHAISIDERRCFYRDNLWIGADKSRLTKEVTEQANPGQDLLQIWFAGVHSDVGGSYAQKESGLSNIALEWLIGEAEKAHAATEPAMCALVLGEDVPPTGDAAVDHRIDVLKPLYEKPESSKIHKSLRGLWWLLELLPHRYYDKDDGKETWRTPLGMRRRIPSGAYIHKTVKERIEKSQYRPKNLKAGAEALHPINVPTQPPGSVYVYTPAIDSKPFMNWAAVRVGVMFFVTAFEIAVLGGIAWGFWHLWRH